MTEKNGQDAGYSTDVKIGAERQYLIYNKTLHKYDIALVVVFLSFSVVYMLFSSFNIFSVLIFLLVIIVAAMGGYLFFLMPILKFKQAEKYHEEYTLIFSKNIIRFKTPSIESELKWNIYSMLWENHDFYYLIQAFEEFAQSNLKAIVHM